MSRFEFFNERIVISCKGLDAEKFLQGLVTNDVKQKACYSMMLSPTGKFLFDFFIYKIDCEHYLIDSANRELINHLLSYKLRNRVEIENASHEYGVIFANLHLDFMSDFYTFPDARNSIIGTRCILPRGFIEERIFQNQQGLYLDVKYKLTIPDGESDMVKDKSFPLEFGLSELKGVNYAKGCYLGQEAIARAYHSGVIRKHLYKVSSLEGSLDLIPKGSEILCESDKVGILCSAYKNLGIGLIRTQDLDLGGKLTVCGKDIVVQKAFWYE